MVNSALIISKYLKGHRRTGIFAVTSRCNCKCEMCDIHRLRSLSISFGAAVKVLDFMAENKFLIAYFTGGEPSLHPEISDIVHYANELGMITSLTTNGTMSSNTLLRLKKAGLYSLSVSIDHWDPEVCAEVKKFGEIAERCKRTIELAKKLQIKTYGLTYLSKRLSVEDLRKTAAFVNTNLGIPLGICYPVTTSSNTYKLGNSVAMHSPQALRQMAKALLNLKKQGYMIANTATYLKDIVDFSTKPSRFYCRAGEYVFYIDWLGDLYPCFLKRKLFNILENQERCFHKNIRCNQCLIDCFREPSILAYSMSPTLILRELRYGLPLRGILF